MELKDFKFKIVLHKTEDEYLSEEHLTVFGCNEIVGMNVRHISRSATSPTLSPN